MGFAKSFESVWHFPENRDMLDAICPDERQLLCIWRVTLVLLHLDLEHVSTGHRERADSQRQGPANSWLALLLTTWNACKWTT